MRRGQNGFGLVEVIITITLVAALCIAGLLVWGSKHKTLAPQVTGRTSSGNFSGTIAFDNCNSSGCLPYSIVLSKTETCKLGGTPDLKPSDDGKTVKITGTLSRLEAGPCILQVKSIQFE